MSKVRLACGLTLLALLLAGCGYGDDSDSNGDDSESAETAEPATQSSD